MKKVLIASISSLLFFLTSCGGVYTVSGGKADNAEISFVANNSSAITVMVDELEYKVFTVKEKTYRRDRKFKKKAENTIVLKPGQHKVVVTNDQGATIYNHVVFISANEHKIVQL